MLQAKRYNIPYLIVNALLLFTLFFCTSTDQLSEKKKEPAPVPAPPSPEEIRRNKTRDIIAGMSPEEKIGQVFMIRLRGKTRVDYSVRSLFGKYHPGGVIFFADNIRSTHQLIRFILDLQALSSRPLFMAVDEEGGDVARLQKKKIPVFKVPSARYLGRHSTPEQVYRIFSKQGESLKLLGFNMNMAPVADLWENKNLLFLKSRVYGAKPDRVAAYVQSAVQGLQEHRVIAVLKHFPGHGDVNGDSHLSPVRSEATLEEMRKGSWKPFEAGIRAGSLGVMMGHIIAPHLTENQIPASLSPVMIQKYLRGTLGFRGLVITDSLNMRGIRQKGEPPEESAFKALKAGADILLDPPDFRRSFSYIQKQLEKKNLDPAVLERAVFKNIYTKLQFKIINPEKKEFDIKKLIQDFYDFFKNNKITDILTNQKKS